MRFSEFWLPAAAGFMAAVAPLRADLYEFRFGGTITAADRTAGSPLDGVNVLDSWELVYRFASPQTDRDPFDGAIGTYSLTQASVTIGSASLLAPSGDVLVLDEYDLGTIVADGYLAHVPFAADFYGSLLLYHQDGPTPRGPFHTIELPTTLDLGAFPFGSRQFVVSALNGLYVSGTVATFEGRQVPAPGGALIGLAALFVVRRGPRAHAWGRNRPAAAERPCSLR